MSRIARELAHDLFPTIAGPALLDAILRHVEIRHGHKATPGDMRLRVEPIATASGRLGARILLHLDLLSADPPGGEA